jgi:hypothetical protein
MKITVELPDNVTEHANPGQEALEALVIEGYRSRTLTQFRSVNSSGSRASKPKTFSLTTSISTAILWKS